MSRPRFAAITADLLARKGEARPWGEAAKPAIAWDHSHLRPAPAMAAPEPMHAPVHPGDWKKCSVRMTHHDYERLGLLAVKRGTTRHHLLQAAVDAMLCGLPYQGSGCACIANPGPPPTSPPPIPGCEHP